jgi:hypothetical protein
MRGTKRLMGEVYALNRRIECPASCKHSSLITDHRLPITESIQARNSIPPSQADLEH